MSNVAQLIMEHAAQVGRAREEQGRIWGTLASSLGSVPGQVMNQDIALREQTTRDRIMNQQLESGGIQLGQQRNLVRGQQAVNAAMQQSVDPTMANQGPSETTPTGVMDTPNFLQDVGGVKLWNMPALTQHLASQGLGAEASVVLKVASDANNDALDQQKTAAAMQASKQNAMAKAAGSLAELRRIGVPREAAIPYAYGTALANGFTTADELKKLDGFLGAGTPEQEAAKLSVLSRGSQAPIKGGPGDVFLSANDIGGPPLASVAPKVTYESPIEMVGLDGKRVMVRPSSDGKSAIDLQGAPVNTAGLVKYEKPTDSTEWVVRDGKTIEIQKGTTQSGDVPYHPPPNTILSGMNKLYSDIDPKSIADAIRAGEAPPDISQYGRPAAAAIASELSKPDERGVRYNLSNAQREWKAQINLNRTMNGTQQVRLDESIRSGLAMYDRIDQIATEWDGKGWGPLSRANLLAAEQGAKGPKAQDVAVRLSGQIAQLTSDVATIEQGGLTPTNDSRDVAAKSMQDWWSKGTIYSMTAQGRWNMQARELARRTQSIQTPGNNEPVVPATPATPPTSAPLAAAPPQQGYIRVVGPNGQTGQAPANAPLPPGWKRE